MFVPWFDGTFNYGQPIGVQEKTGWQAYGGLLDVLIILLAALPIGVAAAKAAGRTPALPLEQGLMVLAAGVLLVLIVGIRLIDPPELTDVAIPNVAVDISRKGAAFVALVAALAVAAGGHLQRRATLTSDR
jgi:hypothetical protein